MNRQQLFTASGALLATTALAGVANAASVGTINTGANGYVLSTKTVKVANTIFSATAATANAVTFGGAKDIGVSFANSFTTTTKFSVDLLVSGATFVTTGIKASILTRRTAGISASGSFAGTLSATTHCTSITPLLNEVSLFGCSSSSRAGTGPFAGGILLSGVSFTNAAGLATVGGVLALSGSVYNANNVAQVFETITSANTVTATAPVVATIVPATNVVASPLATPVAFEYLSTTNKDFAGVTNNYLSMTLATVSVSATGTVGTDLVTAVTVDTATSSINVTTTAAILSSAAVSAFSAVGNGVLSNNVTAANFAGGSATFSVNSSTHAGVGFSSFGINIAFNGTTVIPKAASGTISIVFGNDTAVATAVQAVPTVTGATAAVNQGGFNAEVETFLPSTNLTFNSYIRIHNNGAIPGTVSITVKNDATGAQLGSTFTSASIASGSTLQLSALQLETGAGFTAAAGVNYTVDVTGPIIGYVQHILFNPATGQVSDLSAFRNNGQDASAP